MQHSLAGIEIVPGMLRFVLVNDRNRHIIGYLEPRPDLQRAFCPQVIFLEGFISYLVDAVHIIEPAGDIVVGLVRAAGNRQVMLRGQVEVLVEQLVPVGAVQICPAEHTVSYERHDCRKRRILLTFEKHLIDLFGIRDSAVDMVRDRLASALVIVPGRLPPVNPFDRICYAIRNDSPAVYCHGSIIGHHWPALDRVLGSDENHTECTSGTVHCSRRCILQDADALHIIRIDSIDITGDTIYEHKGRTA